jgi:hypothetical protein
VYCQIEGSGHAYDGDALIAPVVYALNDVALAPSASVVEDGTSPAGDDGERNLYGLLRFAQADILTPYIGARLTLQLQDGRRLPFTVAKRLTETSSLIQGLGSLQEAHR